MLIEKQLEKSRCIASVGAPNPKEYPYWADLAADPVGRIFKTFDGRSGWMQCSYSVPESDEQMNGVYQTIEDLENKLTELIEQVRQELQTQIDSLSATVSSLSSTISSLSSTVSSLTVTVNSINTDISSFEERLSALEAIVGTAPSA